MVSIASKRKWSWVKHSVWRVIYEVQGGHRMLKHSIMRRVYWISKIIHVSTCNLSSQQTKQAFRWHQAMTIVSAVTGFRNCVMFKNSQFSQRLRSCQFCQLYESYQIDRMHHYCLIIKLGTDVGGAVPLCHLALAPSFTAVTAWH